MLVDSARSFAACGYRNFDDNTKGSRTEQMEIFNQSRWETVIQGKIKPPLVIPPHYPSYASWRDGLNCSVAAEVPNDVISRLSMTSNGNVTALSVKYVGRFRKVLCHPRH